MSLGPVMVRKAHSRALLIGKASLPDSQWLNKSSRGQESSPHSSPAFHHGSAVLGAGAAATTFSVPCEAVPEPARPKCW